MIFEYEAVDPQGTEVRGEASFASEAEAIRDLKSKSLLVISIDRKPERKLSRQGKKGSVQDLVTSFHEMVTLLEAGVSISDTIESQCLASYPADLSESYNKVAQEIRKGDSFASALEKSGLNLPSYLYQFAKAGEMTGDLAKSLRNGLNQFEYELSLRRDFKSTLTYPAILVTSGIVAIALIFALVVPKFLPMLDRAEDLPLLSVVVFKMGVFFNDYWALILGIASVSFTITLAVLRHKENQEKLFDLLLSWPVFGEWLREVDIARWCSTLAALLSSKVDLLESISLANAGALSRARRDRLDRVITHVRSGKPLADALEQEGALTQVGYNLIRSGEKAGQVAAMVASLAKLYDDGARSRMKNVLSLVEPLSILLIGAVIGLLVIGVMLAITSVNLQVV